MDWLTCNEQRQDICPSREEVGAAGTLKLGQRGRGVSGVTGLQGPSGPTLPFPTILGAGTESQWGEQLSWGRGGGGGSLWVTFWLRRAWFWGSSWRPQGWGGGTWRNLQGPRGQAGVCRAPSLMDAPSKYPPASVFPSVEGTLHPPQAGDPTPRGHRCVGQVGPQAHVQRSCRHHRPLRELRGRWAPALLSLSGLGSHAVAPPAPQPRLREQHYVPASFPLENDPSLHAPRQRVWPSPSLELIL